MPNRALSSAAWPGPVAKIPNLPHNSGSYLDLTTHKLLAQATPESPQNRTTVPGRELAISQLPKGWDMGDCPQRKWVGNGYVPVRGQNFSSDALFTPKMDIFKQTILNTAYIKTLENFLLARKSLSIQTSISRSVRNQSSFHGS